MKILKKINKGFILTIIVILILSVYLFNIEVKRNSAKPDIQKAVEEYIELANEYAVLPEDMQKLNTTATSEDEIKKANEELDTKITEHINKYKEALKDKMIDNQTVIDMQASVIESFIQNSNNVFSSVVTKYENKLNKITKYVFDEDQVTVTFTTDTDIEIKYLSGEDEKIRTDKEKGTESTMTLQLVDNEWKVVYTDIQYYVSSTGSGLVITY